MNLEKRMNNREYGFVVHRTMADPKWLDPSIDQMEENLIGVSWVSQKW